MSLVLERIHAATQTLGLATVDVLLESHLEQAVRQERPYAEVVLDLLEAEVESA